MIICPVCGFRNPDANDQCFRCSALLKRKAELVDEAFDRADQKQKRLARRQIWAGPLERLRDDPFVQKLNALPDDDHYRYPFTAGLLSIIFPGLGHIYAGQRLKGFLLAAVTATLLGITAESLRASWSNYFLFALLLYWLMVWASSVATAMRANGDTLVIRHVMALFFGGMMLLGGTLVAGQYLGLGIISVEKITTDAMMPSLERGERVLFSGVPLWFRAPRRGEIISFDPPRFDVQRGEDAISMNISRYFQRVVGLPGDKLKREGYQFWRNGELLTREQLPFGVDTMGDLDLIVPPGMVYAPLTYLPEADIMGALSGAPHVPYYGAEGFVFVGWKEYPFVPVDSVERKGIAVIDPPARREWLP
jgi:signal peptidase I